MCKHSLLGFLTWFMLIVTLPCLWSQDLSTGQTTVLFSSNGSYTFRVDVDGTNSRVTITTEGPSDKFWGLGFGSTTMNGTYAILFNVDSQDNASSDAQERILDYHAEGEAFNFTEVSITIDLHQDLGATQRFVVSRDSVGYFPFSLEPAMDNCIHSLGVNRLLAFGHGTDHEATSCVFEQVSSTTQLPQQTTFMPSTTSSVETTEILTTPQQEEPTTTEEDTDDGGNITKQAQDWATQNPILAAIIGGCALLFIVGLLCSICCCGKKKKKSDQARQVLGHEIEIGAGFRGSSAQQHFEPQYV